MIVNFLEGDFPDYNNRYLSDIWRYNDVQMEKVHDYIQWVFPLDTASKALFHAPVLIDGEIEDIQESDLALSNLLKSKTWFIRFLKRTEKWLLDRDHNHKRIARMIRGLRLLHSDYEANLCLDQIIELSQDKRFANTSILNHWRKC